MADHRPLRVRRFPRGAVDVRQTEASRKDTTACPRSACFVVRRSTQVSATLATKEKKEEEEKRLAFSPPVPIARRRAADRRDGHVRPACGWPTAAPLTREPVL